jgi:hypothetical protein
MEKRWCFPPAAGAISDASCVAAGARQVSDPLTIKTFLEATAETRCGHRRSQANQSPPAMRRALPQMTADRLVVVGSGALVLDLIERLAGGT